MPPVIAVRLHAGTSEGQVIGVDMSSTKNCFYYGFLKLFSRA